MKLVRDKVPDVIRARGDGCRTHVCASDFDYNGLLLRKIAEEFNEAEVLGTYSQVVGDSPFLEELADLTEAIFAMVKFRGWTIEDLERVRLEKRERLGGFEGRIVLEEWWKR